jgi:putative salt-induced outer membrane protein
MNHRTALVAAALAAAALAPRAVRAQAPPAPPAAAPAVPLTRTTIDLGFISASGNTRLRTLNAAEQLVVQPGPWKFTQTFGIVSGYTSGAETANNIHLGVRGDYAVSPRVRAYGLAVFDRDPFAGIARRFGEQVGVSYGALIGPAHVLDLEAGAGRNEQTSPAAAITDYWLGRGAVHYRFTFRPNSYVDEKLELLQSLQSGPERRINSDAALVAPLVAGIALRFGYTVHFVNQPPPGFKKTDQMVSSGVQIVF